MAKHSTKLLLVFLPLLVLVTADCDSAQTVAATNRFIETYNFPEPPQLPIQRIFRFEDLSNGLPIDTDAETCVNHPFSYRGTKALNIEACDALTGGTWGAYTTSEIMGRFHSWKAPVLILIFLFPRPPLGIATWIFTLVHLCGDPVDTIASLLYTLAVCQTRVKRACKGRAGRDWKPAVLLIGSYDEYGNTEGADELEELYAPSASDSDEESGKGMDFPECCREKARALAADHATSIAGVTVSVLVFIYAFAESFVEMGQDESGPLHWPAIEAHSGAFSLTLLWIVMAIPFASAIGVSQSTLAVERIIQRLERHDSQYCPVTQTASWGRDDSSNFWMKTPELADRRVSGGIAPWRPDKLTNFRTYLKRHSPRQPARVAAARCLPILCLASIGIVSVGTLGAFLVSGNIPPVGFGCRPICQMIMLLVWLVSFSIDCGLGYLNPQPALHFHLSLAKDTIATLIQISMILITQWGILQRCSCWNQDGMFVLPNYQWVVDTMDRRMKLFAGLIFGTIGIQLLFVGIVAWYFWQALQVYLQGDDGKSKWLNGRRLSSVVFGSVRWFGSGSGGQDVPLRQMELGENVIAPVQTRQQQIEPSRNGDFTRQRTVTERRVFPPAGDDVNGDDL